MQHPSQARRGPASPSSTTPQTRRLITRARTALGLVSRLAGLLTVVLALAVPLQSSQSVAFATHTNTTPTPAPWGFGSSQSTYNPGFAIPTPTLYGYGSSQSAQGQAQHPGSSVQPGAAFQDPANAGSTGQ